MSQIEWYYARGNKQSGPVSSIELKRLADDGEIRPDDLVWREGMTEWSAARNVRGLFEEEGRGGAAAVGEPGPKAVDAASQIPEPTAGQVLAATSGGLQKSSRHFFDSILDSLKTRFNARLLDSTAELFRDIGAFGLFVAMALFAAHDLIVVTKTPRNAIDLLPMAGLLLTLVALQYAAVKFCRALPQLIRKSESSISSAMLPDCVALLCFASGFGGLFAAIALAIHTSLYTSMIAGVGGFVVWGYLGIAALNLQALNVTVAEQESVGREWIGAVSFFLKAVLQCVPVAFGVGVTVGILMAGLGCYQAFSGSEAPNMAEIMSKQLVPVVPVSAISLAKEGVLYSAALPIVAYVGFLFFNLIIEIWRAVLSIPSKLDKLSEKGEKTP